MHLDATDVILAGDRLGIIAVAFGAVELGIRRRMDVFGLVAMGVVASTGGGLLRDVILNRTPAVLDRTDLLALALIASAVAIPLASSPSGVLRPALAAANAVGLGAFAVAGAFAAVESELPVLAVVAMAIVTATGGGVVRDLLADSVPNVLRAEANATAAALAGLVVWALEGESTAAAALAGLATAAIVRAVTAALDINLPIPGRYRPPPGSGRD